MVEENISDMYQLEGSESLGSCLCIVAQVDSTPSISNYHIQWYRMLPGGNKELILGKRSCKSMGFLLPLYSDFVRLIVTLLIYAISAFPTSIR